MNKSNTIVNVALKRPLEQPLFLHNIVALGQISFRRMPKGNKIVKIVITKSSNESPSS